MALVVFGAVVALAGLSLKVFPKTWNVEALVLAQPVPIIAALSDPARAVPRDAENPTRAARETLLTHDHLVELIGEADLLHAGPAGWAVRLKRALRRWLVGPEKENEKLAALEKSLRKSLYVVVRGDTVRIGVDWPDPDAGYRLIEAAQRKFVDLRVEQESAAISEVVRVLEEHSDESRRAVDTALQSVRDLRTPGAPKRSGSPTRRLPELRTSDVRAARIEERLQAARDAIAHVEDQSRRRRIELENRVAELKSVYTEQHPAIVELRKTIAALPAEPPDLERLREEEESLRRERRQSDRPRGPVLALDPVPSKPEHHEDDGQRTARGAELQKALARQEMLLRRLENARIELEVARAASRYRYELLRPANPQTVPVKPKTLSVMGGAFLCGLLLACFAAMAVDGRVAAALAREGFALEQGFQEGGRDPRRVLATVATLAILVVGLLLWTSSPWVALAPLALLAVAWALWTRPLLQSALALLFLMLALEAPGDAGGRWQAPWAILGHLLNTNLNLTLPISALRFTGFDVLAAAMVFIVLWRRAKGTLGREAVIPTPRPLRWAAVASLGTLLWLAGYGVVRGGDLNQVLWQCHQFAMIPVVFFILQSAIRGPHDFPALGKTVLAAAVVKAVQAIYVRTSLGLDTVKLPTATSHADSMLFASALCMLIALCLEERSKRHLRWCILLAPVLALGMIVNNRRLVWVELAAALAVLYALAPRSGLKRKLSRVAVASVPILLLYVAVGWNGHSQIFSPVEKIRSVVDSKSDRSTEERDVENYNLVRNLLQNPVMGLGFGHEYVQFVKPDDISRIFPQWRFIPHNSVLGLFAFGGVAGFSGLMSMLVVGVFFAGRAHRCTRDPMHRAAAVTSVGAVLIYLIQCYGDMGFVSWHGVYLIASALTVAGKLGVACGAWSATPRQSGAAQPWRRWHKPLSGLAGPGNPGHAGCVPRPCVWRK